MVVTTESNSVVSKRCKNGYYFMTILQIRLYGIQIQSLTSAVHGDILFAGNDLNDMQAMLLDFSFTSDAHIQIKQIATHLLALPVALVLFEKW